MSEAPSAPPIRVALCIPWQNQVDAEFCRSLTRLYGRIVGEFVVPGYADLAMFTVNGTYLPQSRRELVTLALEWDPTHLLWFDSDMVFPDHTFRSLLKHDQAIVGCNYARRRPPFSPTAIKSVEGDVLCYTTEEKSGLEEVEAVGFGVVLMQAKVFDTLPGDAFTCRFSAQGQLLIGEDVAFCQAAKACGHSVFVDHDLSKQVGHMGAFQYKNTHSVVLKEPDAAPLIVVPGGLEH